MRAGEDTGRDARESNRSPVPPASLGAGMGEVGIDLPWKDTAKRSDGLRGRDESVVAEQ